MFYNFIGLVNRCKEYGIDLIVKKPIATNNLKELIDGHYKII